MTTKDNKDQKRFIKGYKNVKKSYDYRDLAVAIDAKDQQAAEETASPHLVNLLQSAYKNIPVGESCDYELGTCSINLTKKAEGLFNGFAKDMHGQVVEKFDDQTIEMVAKNLQLKNLAPNLESTVINPSHPDEAEDRIVAREEAEKVVAEAIENQSLKRVKSLKIRFGDFELELKKAIHDFVTNFKKSQEVDKHDVAKAVKSWRRNISKSMHFGSDQEAAKELVENWELHKESFNQILFAIQQMQK